MAVVQSIATLVLVAITGWYAWQTKRMVNEAERLRQEQTRPYVSVAMDPFREPQIIFLVIQNSGVTAARNVSFVSTPPLRSSIDDDGERAGLKSVFGHGIPTLVPGATFPVVFDFSIERNKGDFEDRYEIAVSYEGSDATPYTDIFVIDLGTMEGVSYIDRKTVHDAAKALDKIAQSMNRWTYRNSGLHVISDEAIEHKRRLEFDEWERRTREREQASPGPPAQPEQRAAAGAEELAASTNDDVVATDDNP